MAKLVVVVDIPDLTPHDVIVAATHIEDFPMDHPVTAWDVLALMWSGDLPAWEGVAVTVVDSITEDVRVRPAQAATSSGS